MPILFGLLGWLIGAFAAHAAEAIMKRQPLKRPACPYCESPYGVLQWSALLALLTGQRSCRQCAKPFRTPRLLGELFLAVCWGVLVARYGFFWRVLVGMIALIPLEMILVTDLEVKLVPNLIMLPSIAVMLVVGVLIGPAIPTPRNWTWWMALAGAGSAFVLLRLLVWLGVAVFGEGALGEGDITLSTYIGAMLGFPLVLEALLLAFLLGGVGAAAVLATKRGGLNTAIAYGPYLILGAALTLIYAQEIVQLIF
ncbi:MAG: prepilin peptidase [Anaerolineae bacterium]|nr:prepilin peptidase [Anaerolineae bacterium]